MAEKEEKVQKPAKDNVAGKKKASPILIVILILAVIGVIAVVFLTGSSDKLSEKIKPINDAPIAETLAPCSADEPLTFIPSTFKVGSNDVKICFYNTGSETTSPDYLPDIKCPGFEGVTVEGEGHQVPFGGQAEYNLKVTLPQGSGPSECTITLGPHFEEPFAKVQ